MSRILVTGGSGFVGKNLLAHPGLAKHEVFAPNRAQMNLSIPSMIDFVISANKPDIIVHLAGHVGGIQDNINDPVGFLFDNLQMGINVVMAAKNRGVKKLINLGSSCMYPVDAPQPFKEESLLTGRVEPTNEGYALAKLTILRLCQYLNREGFAYKTLIPPGIYGPHANFDGDKAHLVCAVMARLHRAKLEGAPCVPIWGDGTARREFIFAPDLADCIVRAIDEFDSLPEVMNVGRGRDFTVDEWVRGIAEIVGYEGEFTHDPSKPSGQARKVMDISKAIDWGWIYDDTLPGSLRATYDWYLKEVASAAV